MRYLRRNVLLATATAIVALAAPMAVSAAPALRVDAGLAGFVKAGRWAPVHVALDVDAPLSAVLEITWGDTTVRRALALAGSMPLDFYLRTGSVEGAVQARLVAGGRTVASATAPVHVRRHDEPLTVCVVGVDQPVEGGVSCTATLPPSRAPRSLRGYDAADAVVIADADRLLDPAQQAALTAWRGWRALDVAGDLSLTSQPTRPVASRGLPSRTTMLVLAVGLLYIVLLAVARMVARAAGSTLPWWTFGIAAAVIIGACAAVLGVGRIGPASRVQVRHASLLQQVPGTAASVLTVEAFAEFPTAGAYSLRWAAADGTIQARGDDAAATQTFADDGAPTLAGSFGLGARQTFAAEATLDTQILRVSSDGPRVTVTNASNVVLYECRFADGMESTQVDTLEPGDTASALIREAIAGPLVTCRFDGMPAPFLTDGHAVYTSGSTVVAAYLDRRAESAGLMSAATPEHRVVRRVDAGLRLTSCRAESASRNHASGSAEAPRA